MPSTSDMPVAVVSVFVINENEYGAVKDMLKNCGWDEIGSGAPCGFSPYSSLRYSCVSFEKEIPGGREGGASRMQIDLVKTGYSGNMLMCASVMAYYHAAMAGITGRSASVAPTRYSILYGCAGLADTKGSVPERVFLVSEATWAEQGLCATKQIGGVSVDVIEIKGRRLDPFTAICPSGFLGEVKNRMASLMGDGAVGVARAICFDKVMEVDLREAELSAKRQKADSLLLTYRELLSEERYSLVDMETFGFLFGHPTEVDNILVMRVPTDSLWDHSGSGDDFQRTALAECACEFLLPVIRFVEERHSVGVSEPVAEGGRALSPEELQRHLRRALTTVSQGTQAAQAALGRLTKGDAQNILRRACSCLPQPVRYGAYHSQSAPAGVGAMAVELLSLLGVEDSTEATVNGAKLICDLVMTDERGFATARMRDYTEFVRDFSDVETAALDWIYFIEALDPMRRYDTYRRSLRESCLAACEVLGLTAGAGWEVAVEQAPDHGGGYRFGGRAAWVKLSHGGSLVGDFVVVGSSRNVRKLFADERSVSWRGYEDDPALRERFKALAASSAIESDGGVA